MTIDEFFSLKTGELLRLEGSMGFFVVDSFDIPTINCKLLDPIGEKLFTVNNFKIHFESRDFYTKVDYPNIKF